MILTMIVKHNVHVVGTESKALMVVRECKLLLVLAQPVRRKVHTVMLQHVHTK